jgi:ubiquinone/menaquinone biosynthesis C-methylase UbiE
MQRLYNRIARFYGHIAGELDQVLDPVVRQRIATLPDASSSTALEYACGTGMLSLKLAPVFKTVHSRDISSGMLEIAKKRAGNSYVNLQFFEGNILAIDEQEKSYDYVFVSFALHLFPLETEKRILQKLYKIARKAVFIIDHDRKWRLLEAIAEWLEGGYYDQFIKFDFKKIAEEIGCRSFKEEPFDRCRLLTFSNNQ